MFGDSLRLIRKLHGYTAKELSTVLGISPTYLSEIENSKKTPSLDIIERYSKAFHVRKSTILFFDEECGEGHSKKVLRNGMVTFAKALERCEGKLLEQIEIDD